MSKKKNKNGVSAVNNSIAIGGNVQGSNVIVGNNNSVSNQSINIAPLFQEIYDYVDKHPKLQGGKKKDAKAELEEIQAALEDPKPDEGFIARRFRNIQRMSPDIVDVAIKTLQNPIGGVTEVVKRIAQKVADKSK